MNRSNVFRCVARGCAVLSVLLAFGAAAAESLVVLPAEVSLTGPEARQQLLALRRVGDAFVGEAKGVRFASSDPRVVEVGADGIARARGDGPAVVTATAGNRSARVTITVRDFSRAWAWRFGQHVLPVLSKAGCNGGGCHGALAGKGGFRLSLNGYAPSSDHYNITRDARGRRVEIADPARSLLLTKPTTAVTHKGGRRLDPDSLDYRILAEWITGGAPPPADDEARLSRLEILPERSLLQPGDQQRLLVRAHYADGREEDVTRWCKFTSTDETVARVDPASGVVSVIGHGEGAFTAWFSSQIVIARVTSPYPNQIPAAVFARAPRANFIDDLVLDQLQRLRLKPSPRTTDAEFIRRAHLDTIGRLPAPEEVRGFLADRSRDKRERLVDRLLAREEFVDYWTYRWADLLLINGRLLRPNALRAYYDWLRERVARNTPWDELAREIVTATGESLANGASNFYAVHQEPETMAENVSQTFLSLSINCAKCHNHPLEKWTNDQYYSFANLFARLKAKGWGGDSRNGDGERTLYVAARGDLIQPRTGRPRPPAPLDAEPLPADATGDRREYLAEWLTSPDNPYFTKAVVNRVWAAYFGVGIVEPVDDLRVSNPPANPRLLDALAGFLVSRRYDLKALMRVILLSETYQRSGGPLPENRAETRHFSRQYPRRLMAEVLHDAIADITRIPTDFNNVALNDGSFQKTDFYPRGTRALELYDSAVASYFLKAFGRNDREITCECERSAQPSMVQVLHLSNGDALNDKLRHQDSRVTSLLASVKSDAELVEAAYLLCLARAPTARERADFVKALAAVEPKERRAAAEDLFWALMTSREFLFQH